MSDDLKEQKEALRQQAVALSWMRKHLYDYSPCQANSELLGKYLEEHGLSFSEDTLDMAAAALGEKLAPATVAAPASAASPSAPATPSVPDGQTWPMTRAEVTAMPRSDFRFLYHSKKYGEAFRAHIAAIYNRPEVS